MTEAVDITLSMRLKNKEPDRRKKVKGFVLPNTSLDPWDLFCSDERMRHQKAAKDTRGGIQVSTSHEAPSQDMAGRPLRYGAYPELSIPGVLTGYVLGVIIAISIGYASLKLGFSIEGSELAAILGFAILRGVLGRHSIVENNLVQTTASAVNGAASGMMFSIPAIFILGLQDLFDPWLMTFGCIAGAFLGIAFIVPLRKQMIDFERLTFPGGVAVATILKSPGAGMKKATYMIGAGVLSGAIYLLVNQLGMDIYPLGAILGLPDYMNVAFLISLMTVGVGFIAGKGGVAFIIGGYTCYFVLAPLLSATGALPVNDAGEIITNPGYLMGNFFRPTGIGMLIGGAITGVLVAFPLIKSAIRAMQNASNSGDKVAMDEMPIKLLYMAITGAVIVLAIIAINSVETMGVGRGIIMALLGTLWIWMSGVILSEAIGRTNWSPLSGMTLVGVTILIVAASGLDTPSAIVAAITVGAATSVAMSQATDLMLDMKTGYLVGATPKKQQISQFLGAWIGPIVIITVIFVLHEAYTLGSDELPAPQGVALASMIDGVTGGDVPLMKYLAGAGLGALLSAAMGGLGITVGLGFYLPFAIVMTYSIGTLLRVLVDTYKGHDWSENVGIPIAAGLIVGEALVGVGIAVAKVVG